MVSEDELKGFRRDRYLARSWALLTRDRGWVKPVLLMTVAVLVPIVGLLGVLGYALEWARLTAWNVNAAPKQRGVDVGACIKSGWRAFLVMLVWGIVSGAVIALAEAIPLLGPLVSLVWVFGSFFYAVVVMAAALRATIYQKIGAGLRVGTIWQMVRHDPAGLLRVTGLVIAGGAVLGVATTLVGMVCLASAVPHLLWFMSYLYEFGSSMSSDMGVLLVMQLVASLLSSLGPALVVLLLVDSFLGIVLALLSYTAVGLWMRQFDVPSWGRDEDPLPTPVADPRDQDAASAAEERPQLVAAPVPTDQDAEKDDGQSAEKDDEQSAEKDDEPRDESAVDGATDDGPVIDESR